jgi:hypothetical protein
MKKLIFLVLILALLIADGFSTSAAVTYYPLMETKVYNIYITQPETTMVRIGDVVSVNTNIGVLNPGYYTIQFRALRADFDTKKLSVVYQEDISQTYLLHSWHGFVWNWIPQMWGNHTLEVSIFSHKVIAETKTKPMKILAGKLLKKSILKTYIDVYCLSEENCPDEN